MTTEEWADKLCIALSEAYATGGITAKRIIIPILESALAERTEQCAKIADYEREQAKALFMECKDERNAEYAKGKERAADFIQLRIRALNQPENKASGNVTRKRICDFEPSVSSAILCAKCGKGIMDNVHVALIDRPGAVFRDQAENKS